MRGFWLFVHYIGFTLWLGAGIATMIAGVAAKRFAPAERLAAYRLTGAVQRLLVGPGAVGVVVSGVVLSVSWMRSGDVPGWLVLKMTVGMIGALVALGLSVPTAARLGVLELDPRGELPEAFQGLRRRQIWTATIAGSMGLIALGAAALR